MRTPLIAALLLASCGEPAPTLPPAEEAHVTEHDDARPEAHFSEPDDAPPAAETLASIRERSSCAFESPEALCEGFREHYLSASPGWVSEGCALGERRVSNGPFAEARVIGLRVGYGEVEVDARVDRPLLAGSVREPAGQEGTTQLVLAARVGNAWFPIHVFHPRPKARSLATTSSGPSTSRARS